MCHGQKHKLDFFEDSTQRNFTRKKVRTIVTIFVLSVDLTESYSKAIVVFKVEGNVCHTISNSKHVCGLNDANF